MKHGGVSDSLRLRLVVVEEVRNCSLSLRDGLVVVGVELLLVGLVTLASLYVVSMLCSGSIRV